MDIIDRAALIVRPKQPFLDWASADDAEGLAQSVYDDMRADPAVYLVPPFEGEDPAHTLLKRHWREVFESMLEGWLVDESGWPARRTLSMFQEWHEVDVATVVEVLGWTPDAEAPTSK